MALLLSIRTLRKEQGLTLQQLADKIGVSAPHLSEVERGKKNLNNHLMERLAKALSVTPQDLFGEAPAPSDPDLQEIVDLWSELTPEVRQFLRTSAKAHRDAMIQDLLEADEKDS